MSPALSEARIGHARAMATVVALTRQACAPGVAVGASLPAGCDWESVVALALKHGVSPLVAQSALALPVDALPQDLRAAFARHLDDNTARNEALARVLCRLLDTFAARGIHALPFKGQTLGAAAFGDYRVRRAGDIDLLLRRHDREAACAVLEALGYRETSDHELGRSMTPAEWAVCRSYQCEYAYFNPEDRALVEPHWALAPRTLAMDPDYEGLWARASTIDIDGRAIPALGTADLLLVLCLHGSKHEWVRLQWIADVAALLARQPDVDLAALLRTAAARGLERMVLLGLGLATNVFDTVLPEAVAQRLRADAQVRWLIAQVVARLAAEAPEESSVFQLSRFRWCMRERLRDRAAYAMRTILTPREVHVRLVPWLRLPPLGYVPVKLAHDYVALPLGRLWRNGRARPA